MRDEKTVEAFLDSLRGAESVSEHWSRIRAWAARGEIDLLVSLTDRLRTAGSALGVPVWAVRGVLERIERVLGLTPGYRQVEALLGIYAGAPPGPRVAAIASMLGFAQPQEFLDRAIEGFGEDPSRRELLACWMHERVARTGTLERSASARRFAAALAEVGHPLAILPLGLGKLERDIPAYLPVYSGDASITWPRPDSEGEPVRRLGVVPEVIRRGAVTVERRARLEAAVSGWVRQSNGKVVSDVFALSPALSPGEVSGALFQHLPLDCFEDAVRVVARQASATRAFGLLFVCAAGGGAYGGRCEAAYGRLAAWRSLAALVDADELAPLHEVARLAEAASWFDFAAATSWFYDVAWDLGLCVLAPDGTSLSVLAATDTD